MAYELKFTKEAVKGIAALPSADRRRMVERLEALAQDPFNAPGVKKLTGRDGYRLRSGDFRALYLIDGGELIITVVSVANRREAYR